MRGTRSARSAVGAVAVGAAVATGAWFLGVQTPFALSWGLLAVAGALAFRALGALAFTEWAQDEWTQDEPATPQGRNDTVARLAWAADRRRGRLGTQLARRLHALVRRRLTRLGIDPDDPGPSRAVEETLGPAAVALLAGEELSIGGAEELLARIEHDQERHERGPRGREPDRSRTEQEERA
jgi:hypothetical protein